MEELLAGPVYRQYLYGYPHKTAYRALARPRSLAEVWAAEPRDSMTLYVHVPFCEMRCGFCNLFTRASPVDEVVEGYLAALEREAGEVVKAVGHGGYGRVVIGGGTPTFLPVPGLERVLAVVERVLGRRALGLPFAVELSPATTSAEHVALLRSAGVTRVSLGVQSFVDAELEALRRPQDGATVERALDRLRGAGFATLNVDLIYGIDGQTVDTFLASLAAALRWAPEELYLYPLYVRPLTLLHRRPGTFDDARLELYRAGRELLLSRGYHQVSMRMFRRSVAGPAEVSGCQDEATVGLGCGARSYTRGLHYSREWAVAPRAVRGLIDDYARLSPAELARVHHGFELDGDEQRRRYLILGLLAAGVDGAAYRLRFGTGLTDDFPALAGLVTVGLAGWDGDRLALTPCGVERSDAIGPWLHSPRVDALMRGWEAR